MSQEKSVTTEQWITWMGGLVIALTCALSFLYLNFETKASFQEYKETRNRMEDLIYQRLGQIENKIDKLSSEDKD